MSSPYTVAILGVRGVVNRPKSSCKVAWVGLVELLARGKISGRAEMLLVDGELRKMGWMKGDCRGRKG